MLRGPALQAPVAVCSGAGMALKDLLLGRLTGRGGTAPLDEGRPVRERQARIFALIEGSVMPRRITLAGPSAQLDFVAGDTHLCRATLLEGGSVVYDADFVEVRSQELERHLKTETINTVRRFLEQSPQYSVEFSGVEPRYADAVGISAAFLDPEAGMPDARPSAPAANPDTGNRDGVSENPAGADPVATIAPTGGQAPFEFLSSVRNDIRAAAYFAEGGAEAFSGRRKNDICIRRSDISAIEAWRQRMAPHLGNEMLFVMLADGDSKDTYAIATNSTGGVAVELDRQKMGLVCTAWQKSRHNPTK